MSHVRILSENDSKQPNDSCSKRYDAIMKDLNELQENFFKTDVERLVEKVMKFFDEQSQSPFPVIAHIMPPQDLSDALPFISALKKIEGVEFVDHQMHHIQNNRVILFHCTPPPSDIPRVTIFEKCFEYSILFDIFVSQILCFLFHRGISPDPKIIGILKSIISDRYPSFTFLFTIIRQSIFEYISSKDEADLVNIIDFNDFSEVKNILKEEDLPISLLIKLREDALQVSSQLLISEQLNPFLLKDATNYSYICSSELFESLKTALASKGDDYIQTAFKNYGSIIKSLPELPKKDTNPISMQPPKTKSSRMKQLMNASANSTEGVNRYSAFMQRLFIDLDPSAPNYMPVSNSATFNPRKSLNEALSDPENKSDTAIAYQILQEYEKSVSASEWMRAFQAKANIEDKALALSRFQVSVSELEYLGYTNQHSRKNAGFRHIIRV